MRILELSLRNYRVFDEVDLELPARVIGIFGSNGAGKSSLVEAIRYGLYGETRTDRKQVRTHGVLTEAAVRLVFEHGGQQYEVRRTIKGKNHSAEAELFVGDAQLAAGVTEVNGEVHRLLHMDQKVFRASVFAEQNQLDAFSDVRPGERKEMVLRLLGIRPVDVARSAARKQSRERKGDADRLLETLPDLTEQQAELDRHHLALAEAQKQLSAAAEALTEAERRANEAQEAFEASDRLRERVEKLAVERRGSEERAETHARNEAELKERIEDFERDLAELPKLEEELEGLRGVSDRFAAAQKAAETLAAVGTIEAQLGEIPQQDAATALADLEQAQQERDRARESATRAQAAEERAVADLAEAEDSLARASEADSSEPCPTCGRPLGDDFEEYLAHCKRAVAAAKKKASTTSRDAKTAASALRQVEAELREVIKRGEEARTTEERRGRLDERLREERERLDTLLSDFDGEMPDIRLLAADAERERELGGRVKGLGAERRHLDRARADLERETMQLASCRTRLAEIDEEAAQLAFDAEGHASIRKERDEAARLLEQARIQDREARDLVRTIEREVSRLDGQISQARETAEQAERLREDARYLGRTTVLLDGFRDHLVGRIGPELSREAEALFRELTGAEYDDLRIDEQTLAIHIADGSEYFPIERFSGSETDLANLALRVAISKHLSYMSGADIGMLVLDEALGSLDVERRDLFVRAMGRLSNHFHQLFVITHADQVKDQFQAVIEVQKVGRRRSRAVLA